MRWFFRLTWKRVKMGAELAWADVEGRGLEMRMDQLVRIIKDPDFVDYEVCLEILALRQYAGKLAAYHIADLLLEHRAALSETLVRIPS